MAPSFELVVELKEGGTQYLPLAAKPLAIGRSPASDLVLPDGTISWHHAQVWVEHSQVWIRDLNSRNGTFVDKERVRTSAAVSPESEIRLGARLTLAIRSSEKAAPTFRVLQLEDLTDKVRFTLRAERFNIGSAADADLRIEGAEDRAATLLIHDDGEVWIGTDDDERPLALDESFEVAGREYRIVAAPRSHAPTVEWGDHPYPYRVEATIDGPTGPQARLVDDERGVEKLLTGNKGVLLYLLAKKLQEDRNGGLGRSEEGWCNDADVARGVWGRATREANTLHVLIYRTRNTLKKAGFDPWFIEKRQWGIRARLREVILK